MFFQVFGDRNERTAGCVHRIGKDQILAVQLLKIEVGFIQIEDIIHVRLLFGIIPLDLEQGEGCDVSDGRVLLNLLAHDHRRKQRPAEHHAHHRVVDDRINVGDSVHRIVLDRDGDGGAGDDRALGGKNRVRPNM